MATREEDIQNLSLSVLNLSPEYSEHNGVETYYCPFCEKHSDNPGVLAQAEHETNCPVLIAKDLSTINSR